MSKEFSFPNSGTCSKQTNFVLNDDHTIASMEVIGGCNGNLKGICRLVKGMKAEDALKLTNKEIAETLHLSEGTVKQYINQLYAKLDMGGDPRTRRARLAEWYQKNAPRN